MRSDDVQSAVNDWVNRNRAEVDRAAVVHLHIDLEKRELRAETQHREKLRDNQRVRDNLTRVK